MTILSSTDLTNMRTCQTYHMLDTCKIYALSTTTNSFGELVESWPTGGSALSCGLDMKPGEERRGPDYTVVTWDATIRLPITTTIDERDKIHITHRFREALSSDLVYEIVSPIQRGPSGIRIRLKRTET